MAPMSNQIKEDIENEVDVTAADDVVDYITWEIENAGGAVRRPGPQCIADEL